MPLEHELLARLEQWLAARTEPPSIFDVIATGDGDLFAAFLLKGFRIAARQAVVGRLEHEATTSFGSDVISIPSAILRVFEGIAGAWSLEEGEKVEMLGLNTVAELQGLRTAALDEVPMGIIERVVILLDIFKATNILLPQPNRADAWIRRPNRAPLFAGQSALEVMLARGLEGLREVRAYLQAQVWST